MKKKTTVFITSLVLLVAIFFINYKVFSGKIPENFKPMEITVTEKEMDEFLLSIGTPEEIIDKLTFYAKYTIYSKAEEEAKFVGLLDSDTPCINSGEILDSELTFSTFVVRYPDGIYEFFPSFVWHYDKVNI